MWLRVETEELHTQFYETDAYLQTVREGLAEQARAEADNDVHVKGGGCCGAGAVSGNDVIDAIRSARDARKARARRRHEDQAIELEHIEMEKREELVDLDGDGVEDQDGTDHFAAYTMILRGLLTIEGRSKYDENFRLHSHRGLQEDLLVLSDVSLRVLDAYAWRYRIGQVFRDLAMLHILSINVSSHRRYFKHCNSALSRLLEARDNSETMWTKNEMKACYLVAQELLKWASVCLSRYHVVFSGEDASAQVVGCISLLSLAHQVSAEMKPKPKPWQLAQMSMQDAIEASKEQKPLADLLTELIEKAAMSQYDRLILLSKGDNRSQSLLESGALFGAAEANSGVGRIQDVHQMLQVIKSVREDIKEDGIIDQVMRKHGMNFSLAAVSGQLMYNLVWTDAQLFLAQLSELAESDIEDTKQQLQEQLAEARAIASSPHSPQRQFEEKNSNGFFSLFSSKKKKNVLGEVGERVPNTVLKIVEAMEDVYRDIAIIVGMPPLALHTKFTPFISLWLLRLQRDFSQNTVESILKEDSFQPLNEAVLFSHSVIDLFRLMHPLSERFKSLPYSKQHVPIFGQLVGRIVHTYAVQTFKRIKTAMIEELRKGLFFGVGFENPAHVHNPKDGPHVAAEEGEDDLRVSFPSTLMVQINNVWICEEQLTQYLDDINLEAAFQKGGTKRLSIGRVHGQESGLEEKDIGSDSDNDPNDNDNDQDDNGVDDEVEDDIACGESFDALSKVFDEIGELFADGIEPMVRSQLGAMLFRERDDPFWTSDRVRNELTELWNYIIMLMSHLESHLYTASEGSSHTPLFSIMKIMLQKMFQVMEDFLCFPAKGKLVNVLNANQIGRLRHARNLTMEMVDEIFAFPPVYVKMLKRSVLDRLDSIFDSLSDTNKALMQKYDILHGIELTLPKKLPFEEREQRRKANSPFLTSNMVLATLSHRRKYEGDKSQDLKSFLSQHNAGYFSKLFR